MKHLTYVKSHNINYYENLNYHITIFRHELN